jgi:hypothetical protein
MSLEQPPLLPPPPPLPPKDPAGPAGPDVDVDEDTSLKKDKTKEDLLVTKLGELEPHYNKFDGKMYGKLC